MKMHEAADRLNRAVPPNASPAFVDDEEIARWMRANHAKFTRNARHAEKIFNEALQQHHGEWMLVFGDRKVRFGPNLDVLLEAVPEQHLSAVSIQHLTERQPMTL